MGKPLVRTQNFLRAGSCTGEFPGKVGIRDKSGVNDRNKSGVSDRIKSGVRGRDKNG